MTTERIIPNFSLEKKLLSEYRFVAGVDEAGVGPLAGPVVAAAVVLDDAKIGRIRAKGKWWYSVRDSKVLSEDIRETLARKIFENSIAIGIGSSTVDEIDSLNILRARLLAMKRAVENLKTIPRYLLVDGNAHIPGMGVPQKMIIDGDAKVLSIACASILAKVTRDNVCKILHAQYPEYGFDQHKGYPTKLHHDRLKQFGPCSEHRKSFLPVKILLADQAQTISASSVKTED